MRNPSPALPWLVLVLTLAAVLRIAAAALMPDQTAHVSDSLTYRALRERLWQGGVFDNPYLVNIDDEA